MGDLNLFTVLIIYFKQKEHRLSLSKCLKKKVGLCIASLPWPKFGVDLTGVEVRW